MKIFYAIFTLLLVSSFCSGQASYEEIILKKREVSNETMKGEESILDSIEKENFVAKDYYAIDENYKVDATLIRDKGRKFKMVTSTERRPKYRRFGYVEFTLNDTLIRISVYSNLGYNKKTKTKNYLFLPVKDATAPINTYGAGRYLDLKYQGTDKIEIDFNNLYNPYCAYSHHYSCPVTPEENRISTYIMAGEKLPIFKEDY